jgi:peptide/nickel transport system substrate-binding protein
MVDEVRFGLSVVAALVLTAGVTHASPLEKPAQDKNTLVIATARGIDNLDPTVTATADSQRYAWQLFDTLYQFDTKGGMHPSLALSYEIAPDGKAYTFTLRRGVKFHNGDTMTSEDVAFSLRRMLDPETKSTRRPYFAAIVADIETPAPDKVVFWLKKQDGAFLNKVTAFLYVLPKNYVESLRSPAAFSANPVGTGPYRFDKQQVGQTLDLVRFENFWGEKPAVQRLHFRLIPDDASRVNALLTGEVDLIDAVPPPENARLAGTNGLTVVNAPVASPLHVRLYSNRPELPQFDVRVRKALNYAVDKKAIVRSVLQGIGEPMPSYISKYYPYGHNASLKVYPYDPGEAKRLLKEAGHPNGFKTSLYSYPGMPKTLPEVLAAFWSQVGIQTEIKPLAYSAWSRLNNTHKTDPMTVMQFANAMYDPAHPVSGAFVKTGTWSDYNNPEVERLFAEAESVTDTAKRGALFEQIDRIIHEDAGAVFISELFYSFAYKSILAWQPQQGDGYFNFRTTRWK